MADVTVRSAKRSDDGSVTVKGSGFTRSSTNVQVDGVDTDFTLVSPNELTIDAEDDAKEIRVRKNGFEASAQITDDDGEDDSDDDSDTGARTAAGAEAGSDDKGERPDPAADPQSNEGTETGRYQPAKIEPGTGPEPYPINTNTNVGNQVDPTRFGGGAQHGIAGTGDSEVFTTYAGDEIYKAFVPAGMEAAPQAITPGTWPSPIDGYRAAVAGVPLVGLIPVGDEKTPYPTGASLGAGKRFWLQTGYYKSATPT